MGAKLSVASRAFFVAVWLRRMASDAMSIDDDDESNIVAGDSDRPAKRVRVDHRRSAAKRLAETDAAADSEWCSPKRCLVA